MAGGLIGVIHATSTLHRDRRGWFMEGWRSSDFVQENIAYSKFHVLRGLHIQNPPQGKLVRCLQGRIWDVVADPLTGEWGHYVLDADVPSSLWIPRGLAHGYYVLSETALVSYAVDAPRCIEGEHTIRWDSYGIQWPSDNPILSDKDRAALPGMRRAA